MPGHSTSYFASQYHASALASRYRWGRPEAEALYAEVLEDRKRTLGPTHESTQVTMHCIAGLLLLLLLLIILCCCLLSFIKYKQIP